MTWKPVLESFAREYANLLSAWEARVSTLTETELDQLRWAVNMPSQTNCWWATFQAAELVKGVVHQETLRRTARDAAASGKQP